MIRVSAIQKAVAANAGLEVHKLSTGSRERRIAQARDIAMTLARELTGLSLPAIGEAFGGRKHSTVLQAVRRVERRMRSDRALAHAIDAIRNNVVQEGQWSVGFTNELAAARAVAGFALSLAQPEAQAA
jgi:chromosomal replication initiator protein